MTYVLVLTILVARLLAAAPPTVIASPPQEDAAAIGDRLMRDPSIRKVVDGLQTQEPYVIEQQMRLCEIPAPPFGESARAAAFKQAFERLGLTNVRIDSAGNVLGERPGLAARPHLVLSAHLDTVFPADTRVTTGPVRIGADAGRVLPTIAAASRCCSASSARSTPQRFRPPGSITFVGTVGEEGLGDLRGVKHLFESGAEGPGGSLRLDRRRRPRHYRQPRSAACDTASRSTDPGGTATVILASRTLCTRSVAPSARIADLQVPREPRTTFNVGRVGGGTSVNSIASSAWMEVDLRSADPAALRALDAGFQKAVDAALADENARWDNRGRLTVEKALVGQPSRRTKCGGRSDRQRCGVGDQRAWAGGPESTRARPTPTFR